MKPTAPNAPERPSWWRDPWALSSIGTGVVAVGVGVGFAVASNQARDDARSPRTMTYSEYTGLWDTAVRRRAIAVTSLIGGGVLLVAGAVRLVLLHRRDPEEDPKGRQVSGIAGPQTNLSLAAGAGVAALIWEGTY